MFVIAIVLMDITRPDVKQNKHGRLTGKSLETVKMLIEGAVYRADEVWHVEVIDLDSGPVNATLERT